MNSLRLPLMDIVSQGVTIDVDVPVDDLRPAGVESVPAGRVHVSGHLSGSQEDVLFIGNVKGVFSQSCDRCLVDATMSFEAEAHWFISTTGEDDDEWAEDDEHEDEATVARHGRNVGQATEIDLRHHVWEELVLATPSKFLCSEDCKGLCTQCGKNLNEGSCACVPEPEEQSEKLAIKGLAQLADMFPDLKPDSDKE